MEEDDLTPDELKKLRDVLRAERSVKTRAAMEKAARLTNELRARYVLRNLE